MADDRKLQICDVAALAGYKESTLYQYRYVGFMPPNDGMDGQHPWWFRSTIIKWLSTIETENEKGIAQ